MLLSVERLLVETVSLALVKLRLRFAAGCIDLEGLEAYVVGAGFEADADSCMRRGLLNDGDESEDSYDE